jgi:hypothetical protein
MFINIPNTQKKFTGGRQRRQCGLGKQLYKHVQIILRDGSVLHGIVDFDVFNGNYLNSNIGF